MNITIKPLSPELATEYFDFFENRAFTDDSPYRCYCQMYQISKAELQASMAKNKEVFADPDGADAGRLSREAAARQIEAGSLRGYLAFVDGLSIGWCNANDRANYPAEPCTDTHFYAPAEKREKAVVCFEIAPEFRGKGVASALLQRVIDDAKAEGCTAVVAFPAVRAERFEWDCQGPIRLYEKAGFVAVPKKRKLFEKDKSLIMRLELD